MATDAGAGECNTSISAVTAVSCLPVVYSVNSTKLFADAMVQLQAPSFTALVFNALQGATCQPSRCRSNT
jgi:hypothetical protein